jgi:hypothetical protein
MALGSLNPSNTEISHFFLNFWFILTSDVIKASNSNHSDDTCILTLGSGPDICEELNT